MNRLKFSFGLLLLSLLCSDLHAQFSIDGQYVQRSEFRNGFGRLLSESEEPFAFLAHRARLQARYDMDYFSFYMSIQDIRVFGSTPQVKASDNFLSVHEAWAMAKIKENWKVKIGRQELNYDNFRFLGNLDWALQARAHDFLLFLHEKEDMKFDFGGGYNQTNMALTDQPFFTPNQYRVAQMARYENKWGKVSFSALFWNDGREWQTTDPQTGAITDKGVRYRSTLGVPTLRYNSGNSQVSAFYYHQFGETLSGRSLNAYNFSLAYNHTIPINREEGKIWTLSAGLEHISGDDPTTASNNAYNPLYGTNHIFNGYMDLFYVGGAHENTVGLQDYFIKSRYAFNKNFFLQADYHLFYSGVDIFYLGNDFPSTLPEGRYFGSELDLTLGWIVNDAFSVQGGYSQFFATDVFQRFQGVANPKGTQNWAYLMLIFRPTMKNRFIGILL
ncbi:alginate export family protein [Arthrospiribacter ruber]|uniref:Alginate export domain-containing protein n=1 Tax=Arthrospiribacter ruber TaxID=2487934 RepID=A0A951IXB8_9BACT|nr:alginate export family protein [Arthrospiribacter ruber]MBW3468508.1 hypothetical protein [Arthrospiribacter ruber]